MSAWLFGSGPTEQRNRLSDRDRPPLSHYIHLLEQRSYSSLAADEEGNEDGRGSDVGRRSTADKAAALLGVDERESGERLSASAEGGRQSHSDTRTTFMQVPFETIGKRIDHNAELANSMLSYTDERTKQVQRLLKDMRKKSPALMWPASEFAIGTLERVMSEVNHLHENEIGQLQSRASSLEMQLRQKLAMARENALGCGSDYQAEFTSAQRTVAKARERLQRSKAMQARATDRLMHVRVRSAEQLNRTNEGGGGGGSGLSASSFLSKMGTDTLANAGRRNTSYDEHGNAIAPHVLEEREAEEALRQAQMQTQDDIDSLLHAIEHQDKISAATAMAFEACDLRIRTALADSIKVLVEVEVEAATKRLNDLNQISSLLSQISPSTDAEAFLEGAKRPEMTHLQSMALSVLHNPDSRPAMTTNARGGNNNGQFSPTPSMDDREERADSRDGRDLSRSKSSSAMMPTLSNDAMRSRSASLDYPGSTAMSSAGGGNASVSGGRSGSGGSVAGPVSDMSTNMSIGSGSGTVGMHNGGVHFSDADPLSDGGGGGGGGGGGSDGGDDEGDAEEAAGVAAVQNAMMHDRIRSDMERIVVVLFKEGGFGGSSRTALAGGASSSTAGAGSEADAATTEPPTKSSNVDPLNDPLSHLMDDPLSTALDSRSEAERKAKEDGSKRSSTAEPDEKKLARLLESPVGRDALLHSLNQQRSRKTEIGEGFDDLSAAIWTLLDRCQQTGDARAAKMAMMLSQTFYRERPADVEAVDAADGGSGGEGDDAESVTRDTIAETVQRPSYARGGREYIKSALLEHPLWQDMLFWDEACWQSIREALKSDADDITQWHELGSDGARDAVLRVHNIVFSQIGAYAHSMVEFGCTCGKARQFVRRLCGAYQLGEEQRQMLLKLPLLGDAE